MSSTVSCPSPAKQSVAVSVIAASEDGALWLLGHEGQGLGDFHAVESWPYEAPGL